MATCQPGEIVMIDSTAALIDLAVKQVPVNTQRITSLETRTENDAEKVSENTDRIGTLETEQVANTAAIDLNTTAVSGLPATYAAIGGSSSKVFEVADPSSATNAVSYSWAEARYALSADIYTKIECETNFLLVGGTSVDSDKLGGMLPSGYVVTTDYATESVASLVRKATASEATAGIDTTTYMTPAQVKAAIDEHIAALHP